MRSFAPFSDRTTSASSSAFTARSSIASAGQRASKPCASSSWAQRNLPLHLRRRRSLGVGNPALGRGIRIGGADAPLCLGGRGAAPPQHCGGPTGYRLMFKRQRMETTKNRGLRLRRSGPPAPAGRARLRTDIARSAAAYSAGGVLRSASVSGVSRPRPRRCWASAPPRNSGVMRSTT